MSNIHTSVLKEEAITALNVTPGKKYIDATLGAGGHAIEIVKRGGTVLGIDQDEDALTIARKNLEEATKEKEGTHWKAAHGNFGNLGEIAESYGFDRVDGILFDLGISSMQIDTPERGMSFRFTDAPLDLRMDRSGGDTAAQLVNRASEDELYDIFSRFGEEQLARRIAHAFCASRPIVSVGDAVSVIRVIVPGEIERIGVLARIFQALRIAVNDELGNLKRGFTDAEQVLVPGGRLVVISFHSLEDRTVKLFMKRERWKSMTKHPVQPDEREIVLNRRAKSAKMRVSEKL